MEPRVAPLVEQPGALKWAAEATGASGNVARGTLPRRCCSTDHLLRQLPYGEVPQEEVRLPERVFHTDYERKTLPPELFVPKVY